MPSPSFFLLAAAWDHLHKSPASTLSKVFTGWVTHKLSASPVQVSKTGIWRRTLPFLHALLNLCREQWKWWLAIDVRFYQFSKLCNKCISWGEQGEITGESPCTDTKREIVKANIILWHIKSWRNHCLASVCKLINKRCNLKWYFTMVRGWVIYRL